MGVIRYINNFHERLKIKFRLTWIAITQLTILVFFKYILLRNI